MRNTERWKLTAETDKICLWVDDVLPLSTAHATVGGCAGDKAGHRNAGAVLSVAE